MKPKTAVVKDAIYLQHITGDSHPESHHRLEVIYDMLKDEDMQDTFKELSPRGATQAELELNHSLDYINQVASTAGRSVCSLDPDTTTSPLSWEAAQQAAGGVLVGVDAVMGGEVENCFALVRPPGHHAEKSRGMGFCLFNNIAIGAQMRVKNMIWNASSLLTGICTMVMERKMPSTRIHRCSSFPLTSTPTFRAVGVSLRRERRRGRGLPLMFRYPGARGMRTLA